jgi:natural product biosynthesis luciferase-like monooxygenase protein
MKPDAIESSYGLTPVQLGMLFNRVHAGGSGVDIEQMIATLREPLDVANLRRAWQATVAQHATLRTRFRWEEVSAPLQEVLENVDLPFLETDLRSLSAEHQTSAINTFLKEDRVRGIDLAQAPLFRLHLFRIAAEESRLVWTFPHILLDGGSFPAVVKEVFVAYEAFGRGEVPALAHPRPYGDHIAWLEGEIGRKAGDASSYFRALLAGFGAKNQLASDARAAEPSGTASDASPRLYGELDQRLSRAETDRLRALAREHGLTLNTFVQAAWSLVVADFSGTRDVVFGVVRACRRSALPEAEQMVGLFINTLPLRVRAAGDKPVIEWLREIRAGYVAQRPFEHTPLQAVQAASEVAKGTSLFDSIIVYNDALMDSVMRAQGGAFARRDFWWIEQTNFPLTLFGYGEAELLLKLGYDRSLVSDELARSMLARASAALTAFATQAERRLGELTRVPAEETRALAAWNETQVEVPELATGGCVHHLFEQQAARTPDAIALVFRGQSLSYRALNERANHVARKLQTLGVGPDVLVGIYVQRSVEMVVGLLGILKAGGAYVPLDPNYPHERIAMMLEDSRAPVIVTEERLAGALPRHAATLLLLDRETASTSGANVESGVTSKNLAYVIYTSGSTGRPKGVMVEHRNVLNFFAGMDERIGRDAGTWLAVTSISFDISVLELFWTLARGFRVVIQEEGDKSSLTKRTAPVSDKRIDFSLFYFAADAGEVGQNRYRLLLEGARYADTHGFLAIWTPERHFHEFGGLYPNPSITSAAVATITSRVQLRAGSVVLPLHNPIRVAEEWSVVDNLSNGRVGLSFASGWHANDFALMPENYAARRDITFKGIETIKKLWRGEAIPVKSGSGADITVKILPRPIQANPPIWVTAAGNVETFRFAGESGANVLTNMLGQSVEDLGSKLAAYRTARSEHGHAGPGHVTLMLHTFVGTDVAQVKELVRKPFTAYLKTSTDLVKKARWEFPAFARPTREDGSAAPAVAERDLTPEEEDALMAHAFERYFETHGLFGTPESCLAMIEGLKSIGVDEVACLIDFGVASDTVLANLDSLNRLRELSVVDAHGDEIDAGDYGSIAAQIRRHGVTHLQCTPSLARMLLEDPDAVDALGSLRRLMVGGEALPAALAEPLSRRLADGALLNMYGPTETTVWSTTAKIEPGVPVTIGRPIANTQIYLLDRELQPTPVGVAGELCIGGDGVVRGYLQRPDLTRERFIPDPFAGQANGDARYYRTGDLARFLPDGRIEFLGRLDHQVKVRGYRIELAEIEAALVKHPAVGQAVVVAREDNAGDQRIVAYVVARTGQTDQTAGAASSGPAASGPASAWQNIWDEAYRAPPPETATDATFNIAGWNSSYTGEAIPEDEMRDWVLNTTQNLRALGARRILELGCGTGLLLFRVAPECEKYTGVDFSQAALDHIAATLARHPIAGVGLLRASADDFEVEAGSYDAVVINSVVQYFPSAEYLARVLERALRALAPGGKLFIGDVRSLPWLEAFHASVELHAAPDAASSDDVAEALARRLRRESELVIAPQLFQAFAAQQSRVRSVRAELKRARFANELTSFRYDVVLTTTGRADAAEAAELGPGDIVELDGHAVRDLAALRAALDAAPVALRVRGLKNARVVRHLEAVDLLDARATKTVGELRAALAALPDDAVAPEALATLNPAYDVQVAPGGSDARRFDATFVHRERAAGRVVPQDELSGAPKPWDDYVHRAVTPGSDAELVAELRAVLRETLPDFMVPSHFVTLAALPLTPNGKIDRKALPAPEVTRSATSQPFAPPGNDLERKIAAVWQEILHVEQVGIHDNFFDLGANSLLIMQANGALRASLGKPVSLVQMFQNPTVASLAAHLGADEAGATAAASAGQDRALNRREAMQRRREQVTNARQPPTRQPPKR